LAAGLAATVPIGYNGVWNSWRLHDSSGGPALERPFGVIATMRLRNPRQFWRQCRSAAASSVAIALVTFASYKLHFNNATVVLLYLLVVVLESLAGGAVASLIVAVVAAACLDFFFLPPLFTFRIADPLNVLTLQNPSRSAN
jgi:K+-sensing histidine kinase KdpD